MKTKKLIVLAILFIMITTILSGCTYASMDIFVYPDGSGYIEGSFNYSEEMYELAIKDSGVTLNSIVNGLDVVEKNGVKYYGQTEKELFNDIDNVDDTGLYIGDVTSQTVENGDLVIQRVKGKPGQFEVIITIDPKEVNIENFYNFAKSELPDVDYDTIKRLVDSSIINLNIQLPGEITQVSGNDIGVTITDYKLNLDLMQMITQNTEKTVYKFISSTYDNTKTFKDIPMDAWYFNSVWAMSREGVIHGFKDNTFRPLDRLTYAQLCKIIANKLEYKDDKQTGYWAEGAIKFCIDNGIIESNGDITNKNYDINVSREVAVSALYRLNKQINSHKSQKESIIIPDYDSISDKYKGDILQAYKYGLVNGVDEAGTFKPKDSLTRAELCVIFNNIS